MKRSQAIHRRLTEDHEAISSNPGLVSGLLARSELDEGTRDRSRIIIVPQEQQQRFDQPANDVSLPEPAKPARSFPYQEFVTTLDPATVKARYLVGPIDPTVLFVGDLDERHGPDLLIRAWPTVLKKHPQARLVLVGDGALLWPLKVMSRYMLLDYAVRIVGHVGGREVRELIAAADVMAVPSRVQTEDWQILSGWSARRPVVATAAVAQGLCNHQRDGMVVEPEASAWTGALDRVLSDPGFGRQLGEQGYLRILSEFAGPGDDGTSLA